ncbi:MAG TPA: sugar kinase [Azospirillaceae bacterium]|nr:sugar kinase [Azospirillaceae bacterium]
MSKGSGARIVCFGELLMRLTAPGRELLLQAPRLEVAFGGAEANVAVSLARLGHDAAMVSVLPDNPIGRACLGELRRHGVDTGGIRTAEGRMGLYFLAVGAMHRASEITYDRADSAFARSGPEAHDWDRLLDNAAWLHVSGINAALGPKPGDAALAAVKAARARGIKVSFDCNYRQKLWEAWGGDAPAILREFFHNADLLFGNERDIGLVLRRGVPDLPPAERFREAAGAAFTAFPNLRWIAATERGHTSVDEQELAGMLATPQGLHRTRPYAMNGIIDRIGGGDAFAAGLLHGLIRGMGEQAALEFAVAAGVIKHSIPGDANLAGEDDIRALVEGGGLDVKR